MRNHMQGERVQENWYSLATIMKVPVELKVSQETQILVSLSSQMFVRCCTLHHEVGHRQILPKSEQKDQCMGPTHLSSLQPV